MSSTASRIPTSRQAPRIPAAHKDRSAEVSSSNQGPKYQLCDPGVSSPAAKAMAEPSRSKLPQPAAKSILSRHTAGLETKSSLAKPSNTPKTSAIPRGPAHRKLPSGKVAVERPAVSPSAQPEPNAVAHTPSTRRGCRISVESSVTAAPLVVARSTSSVGLAYLADEAVSDIDSEKTPTLSSRQSSTSLSDTSTTISSVYSSASSMARSRAAEAGRICFDGESVSIDDEAECAPYLVPHHRPELTLAWQPDLESQGLDPAEEVWKRLEAKLGRQLRGDTISDRGRWVVHALSPINDTPKPAEHGVGSLCMDKTLSDFSVSDYTTMSEDSADDAAGTAIFDMTAPLIPSMSSSAATPANTPYLDRETLHRLRHIRRKGDSRAVSRRTSLHAMTAQLDSVDALPSLEGHVMGSSAARSPPATKGPDVGSLKGAGGMFRLDSHVISALQALQANYDSPDLDLALGTVDLDLVDVGCVAAGRVREHVEGGLGLGRLIRNDSVYSLSTVSQWRRKCAQPSQLPEEWGPSEPCASSVNGAVNGDSSLGHEPIMVTDLDTGLMRALTLKRGADECG